jgi:hypothetical protein
VALFLVVTVWSTLIFQGDKMGQGKGVISSFWLVLENHVVGGSISLESKNQGVVSSFWLEPNNLGSCSFLQVGACK